MFHALLASHFCRCPYRPEARGYTCEVPPGYIRADVLEPMWSDIVSHIRLPENWRKRIEELAGNADERAAMLKERDILREKLRRLTQAYTELLVDEKDYQLQRDQLQSRIAASVPPDSPSVVEAGELLAKLGTLWEAATPEEQRDLTRLMVKDVYVDIVEQRITAIEPLPQFSFLLGEVCEGLEVEVL